MGASPSIQPGVFVRGRERDGDGQHLHLARRQSRSRRVWFAGAYSTGNTVTGNVFKLSQTPSVGTHTDGASGNGEQWTSTNTVNHQ